eukprot:5437194-Pyramimonas_sp.AAC.1
MAGALSGAWGPRAQGAAPPREWPGLPAVGWACARPPTRFVSWARESSPPLPTHLEASTIKPARVISTAAKGCLMAMGAA